MDDDKIKEILEKLPHSPGVYLMKNSREAIVYVGKAKDLAKRVRSYFTPSTSDTRFFRLNIDKLVSDLEVVLTNSEKEAVLLENSLIKLHSPRFNLRLRDDKDFLCIRLDSSSKWPKLSVYRRPKKDGAIYFGPYPSAHEARQTLKLVRRHFKIRSCNDRFMAGRTRPCLQHQMHRCLAPCVLDVDREDYMRQVKYIRLFLLGRRVELLDELKERMSAAALNLEYERAAALRDQIRAVEKTLAPQEVVNPGGADQDIIGMERQGDLVQMALLRVREGRLSERLEFFFSGQEFPDSEVMSSFIFQYYENNDSIPSEVLVSRPLDEADAIADALSEKTGRKIKIAHPKRSSGKALVVMADLNAKQLLKLRVEKRESIEEQLEVVQRRLHLALIPRRIECVDISHLGGDDTVGAISAVINGRLERAEGRLYRIKTASKGDDYLAMKEVLERRFNRAKTGEWPKPDLLVVDGGRGQLTVALAVLKELCIDGQDVLALAKDRDKKTETATDRIFLPGRKNPIALKAHISPLHILAMVRDEAHRLAVSYQRKARKRRATRSALDDIPGIGPTTKKALLKRIGSIKRIREAPVEELTKIPRISPALAEKIKQALISNH